MHLQREQRGLGLLGRDDAHVEILVIVAQRLRVPVRVAEAPILEHERERIRQVLARHGHVPDLRVHRHHRRPVGDGRTVGLGFHRRLGLGAEDEPFRRGGVEDVAARLVGLRLDAYPYARHYVHGLGETLSEAGACVGVVLAEGVLKAISAGPDDREVGVQFDVDPQRLDDPIDGRLPRRIVEVGEAAPLELRRVEEVGHDGEHAHARVVVMDYRALRRLPDQLIPRRLNHLRFFLDDLPLRGRRQRDA